jgi:hypothetical protein
MATKNNPGEFDCYTNALPDEPMFTLLARDKSAPALIRTWCTIRLAEMGSGLRSVEELPQIREAQACADAMDAWREANHGAWRTEAQCEHDWHYVGTDRGGSHKGEDRYECSRCREGEYRP